MSLSDVWQEIQSSVPTVAADTVDFGKNVLGLVGQAASGAVNGTEDILQGAVALTGAAESYLPGGQSEGSFGDRFNQVNAAAGQFFQPTHVDIGAPWATVGSAGAAASMIQPYVKMAGEQVPILAASALAPALAPELESSAIASGIAKTAISSATFGAGSGLQTAGAGGTFDQSVDAAKQGALMGAITEGVPLLNPIKGGVAGVATNAVAGGAVAYGAGMDPGTSAVTGVFTALGGLHAPKGSPMGDALEKAVNDLPKSGEVPYDGTGIAPPPAMDAATHLTEGTSPLGQADTNVQNQTPQENQQTPPALQASGPAQAQGTNLASVQGLETPLSSTHTGSDIGIAPPPDVNPLAVRTPTALDYVQNKASYETALDQRKQLEDVIGTDALNAIKRVANTKAWANGTIDVANFPVKDVDAMADAYNQNFGKQIETEDFIKKVMDTPSRAEINKMKPSREELAAYNANPNIGNDFISKDDLIKTDDADPMAKSRQNISQGSEMQPFQRPDGQTALGSFEPEPKEGYQGILYNADGSLHEPGQQLKSSLETYRDATGMNVETAKNPVIDSSPEAIEQAIHASNVDGKGKGFNSMTDDLKHTTHDWMNDRKAAAFYEGQVATKEFSDLDKLGPDQIHQFQAGEAPGSVGPDGKWTVNEEAAKRFTDVRDTLNDTFQKLNEAGVEVHFKQNYLTQLWKDTPEQITTAYEDYLKTHPDFSKESFYKDYQAGIDAGLTPKYTNISDIVGKYQEAASKALADRKYLNYLAEKGYIQPKSEPGFKELTNFPDLTTRYPKDGVVVEHSGKYYAPEALADRLNNYLGGGMKGLDGWNKFMGALKQIKMSAGIPYTALNIHGITTWGRNAIAASNPVDAIARMAKGAYWLVDTQAAHDWASKNLDKALEFSHYGLKLQSPGIEEGEKNLLGKVSSVFEKPLFDDVLPAMKLENAIGLAKDLQDKGLTYDHAMRVASEQTNSLFGGVNWDQLGTDKNMLSLARAGAFAPDMQKSLITQLAGVAKGLTTEIGNPEYMLYRRIAASTGALYMGMNAINQLSSGHLMFQNEPGHTFEVQMGYGPDGKPRYIRPLGQALDFIKVPIDVATSLVKGDLSQVARVVQNRVSPGISFMFQLASNTDSYGQPIYLKNKDGSGKSIGEEVASIAKTFVNAFAPQQLTAAMHYAMGQASGEQALSEGLSAPVRYGKGASTKEDKALVTGLEGIGQSGQQIHDTLQNEKDVKTQAATQKQSFLDAVKSGDDTATSQALAAMGVSNQTTANSMIKSAQTANAVQSLPPEQQALSKLSANSRDTIVDQNPGAAALFDGLATKGSMSPSANGVDTGGKFPAPAPGGSRSSGGHSSGSGGGGGGLNSSHIVSTGMPNMKNYAIKLVRKAANKKETIHNAPAKSLKLKVSKGQQYSSSAPALKHRKPIKMLNLTKKP
jgi:hypothetical protein